jgi:hypothetical protein
MKNVCDICGIRYAKDTKIFGGLKYICDECEDIYLFAHADAWSQVKQHQKVFTDNEAEIMRIIRDADKWMLKLVFGRRAIELQEVLKEKFPAQLQVNL